MSLIGNNICLYTDHHQYLSQLILLAQIVDEDFQNSVQSIFGIDKITNEATISFKNNFGETAYEEKDDATGDGKMQYVLFCELNLS